MTSLTSVAFAPQLPWVVIAALAGLALALLVYGATRGAPGTAWRAFAFAIGLLALTEPSLVSEKRDMLTDVAAVVVDQSQSQRIGGRATASEQALTEIEERLGRLEGVEVRVVRASNRLASGDGDQRREGTLLLSALAEALADTPRERIAGAILITDGQVHDVPDQAAAASPGGPVHVLLTGRQGERDRRAIIEQAPSYGLVGKTLELRLRIEDAGVPRGSGERTAARFTLRRDGGPATQHSAIVGQTQRVPFTLDHGGQTVIEIEAAGGPQELTLQNNRAVISVNGVRDRLRVLLVSGKPHPGERTWRNLLKADPSVDLVHFTILRPPEKQDGTPVRELSLIAFPVRELFEVKLKEFDLIIFDHYRRRGVLPQIYLGNVVDYVHEGGAILEAAGPDFASSLSLYRTPLASLLPGEPTGEIYREGFRPTISALGRRHPVTADLPGAAASTPRWGRWFRMVDVVAHGGTSLMSGVDDKPLLIVDRAGEGRVAQLLSDHAWLWTRGFEGGGPQAELLRRLGHWLMKEPDLEEEQLTATANGQRLTIVRRSLEAGDRDITLTSPSETVRTVRLEDGADGRASATVEVDEVGLYRVTDGRRSGVAAVGSLNPVEYADVRATDELLGPVAEATGGALVWLARDGIPSIRHVRPRRETAGQGWIGLRRNGQYLVTGVNQLALLPPLLVLVLVLGGFALAWRREGR